MSRSSTMVLRSSPQKTNQKPVPNVLRQKWERFQIGVSRNSGTPKWMVKIMENPIKMDDLGGKPTIFGNIQMSEAKMKFLTSQ